MRELLLWTDGACKGNGTENSRGGYGVVMICGEHHKELKAGCFKTSNNAEEIKAVVAALEAVKSHDYNIIVYSDSAYVINCMNQGWYKKWLVNGWKTSKGEPVKNKDLWVKLLRLSKTFEPNIKYVHVPGHQNIGYNNRADELANEAVAELMDSVGFDPFEAVQY